MLGSKKIFTTSEQLKTALFGISSLNQQQRSIVYEALSKEFDDNGISAEELKRVARELRLKGEISEIDQQNLLQLING